MDESSAQVSSEARNQARWRKLERVVLWFDGLVMLALLSMGFLGILIAIVSGNPDGHGGFYVFMSGLLYILLGISFVMPYLGMRRHTRWRWPAHLLPLLTPWVFEAFMEALQRLLEIL